MSWKLIQHVISIRLSQFAKFGNSFIALSQECILFFRRSKSPSHSFLFFLREFNSCLIFWMQCSLFLIWMSISREWNRKFNMKHFHRRLEHFLQSKGDEVVKFRAHYCSCKRTDSNIVYHLLCFLFSSCLPRLVRALLQRVRRHHPVNQHRRGTLAQPGNLQTLWKKGKNVNGCYATYDVTASGLLCQYPPPAAAGSTSVGL